MHEHSKDENSALRKHELSTGHHIDFFSPSVLATDALSSRLNIKETLKINEYGAYKSLNRNVGSFELHLW